MFDMAASKTGLVLSGGGAKGAYQVGILKALQELGTSVDMVAGASMGALNGAVLACAPSLPEGVRRLENLWNTLAEESPLKANVPAYLKLLSAVGLQWGLPVFGGLFSKLLRETPGLAQGMQHFWPMLGINSSDSALLSDAPLKALMEEYLDTSTLAGGIPLYVSVYESHGGLSDLAACMAAEAGLSDTAPSQFLHVQSLPEAQQREALLASAAIPLLYAARCVDNTRYSDGGQGGWQKAQGNTPIKPLIQAGCSQVIVTHLTDGALWSRHDFPDTTVLEIRPQSDFVRNSTLFGATQDLLGFNASRIPVWMEQGYEDTLDCVKRVQKAVHARNALRQSRLSLTQSEQRAVTVDTALLDALERLR